MGELTCVTLNIWNRFGPWEDRLPRIRDGLRDLSADFVGMQEVLVMEEPAFDQNALIGEGLYPHVAWGKCSKNPHPVGNSILSRFPIKERASFDLPDGGTEEHRVLVHALLETPFGDVPVFVTHLNWKLNEGHVRVAQVKELAAILAVKAPKNGFPPILMGDFNAEPDSDEIRYLRGLTGLGGKCVYFADCFAAAGETKIENDGSARHHGQGIQAAYGATFSRDNAFAMLCHEPNRRIDYVFVRGPDDRGRGEPLESKVCMNVATSGIHPSDHYGVWAKLSA